MREPVIWRLKGHVNTILSRLEQQISATPTSSPGRRPRDPAPLQRIEVILSSRYVATMPDAEKLFQFAIFNDLKLKTRPHPPRSAAENAPPLPSINTQTICLSNSQAATLGNSTHGRHLVQVIQDRNRQLRILQVFSRLTDRVISRTVNWA